MRLRNIGQNIAVDKERKGERERDVQIHMYIHTHISFMVGWQVVCVFFLFCLCLSFKLLSQQAEERHCLS